MKQLIKKKEQLENIDKDINKVFNLMKEPNNIFYNFISKFNDCIKSAKNINEPEKRIIKLLELCKIQIEFTESRYLEYKKELNKILKEMEE